MEALHVSLPSTHFAVPIIVHVFMNFVIVKREKLTEGALNLT